jgi:MbtH protein
VRREGTVREDSNEDTMIYKVVLNHEEQYSIWPADRANAPGWRDSGTQGTRADCLEFIKTVWTDMRPLSLRQAMAPAAAKNA